jgi:hypothetical protein
MPKSKTTLNYTPPESVKVSQSEVASAIREYNQALKKALSPFGNDSDKSDNDDK